jgi:hypothetical protein
MLNKSGKDGKGALPCPQIFSQRNWPALPQAKESRATVGCYVLENKYAQKTSDSD